MRIIEALIGETNLDRIQRHVAQKVNELADKVFSLLEPEVRVVSGNATMAGENVLEYTGPGGDTITLAPANTLGGRRSRVRYVLNNGTTAITLAAQAGDTIRGIPDPTLAAVYRTTTQIPPGGWAILLSNGDSIWRVIGAATTLESLYIESTQPAATGRRVPFQVVADGVVQLHLEIDPNNAANEVFKVHKGLSMLGGGSISTGKSLTFATFTLTDASGLKFGANAAEKWAMHGNTPTDQLGAIADATDLATAITAINTWLAGAREKGVIAT